MDHIASMLNLPVFIFDICSDFFLFDLFCMILLFLYVIFLSIWLLVYTHNAAIESQIFF